MRRKSTPRLAAEIALRVILLTVVAGLLCFAVGLLFGILGSIVYGLFKDIRPDMSLAYRYVAAPFGACGLVLGFIGMLIYEIRRTRRPALSFTGTRTRLS